MIFALDTNLLKCNEQNYCIFKPVLQNQVILTSVHIFGQNDTCVISFSILILRRKYAEKIIM